MTKRLFALFLTLVMVFQPVLPAAAEMAGESPAAPGSVQTVETTEVMEETTEPTEETTEATEETTEATEETTEATEEITEATEETTEATEETTEATEETTEATVETTEPTEETTEAAEPAEEIAEPLQGKGTEEEPYVLSSAQDLETVAALVNGGEEGYDKAFYVLGADLELGSHTPIGTEDHPFRGSFDGSGRRMTGLTGGKGKYWGLFGVVEDASLSGISLEEVTVSGSADMTAGAVVGLMKCGTLERSYAAGKMDAAGKSCLLGGLVGRAEDSVISDSFVQMTVLGYACAGGLAAQAEGTRFVGCYAAGEIGCSDGGDFEALVGRPGAETEFDDCYQVDLPGEHGVFLTVKEACEDLFQGMDPEIWEMGPESYPYPVLSGCPYTGSGFELPDMEEHATGYNPEGSLESAPDSVAFPANRGLLPARYQSDLPEIRHQGHYGTCWAHSVVAGAESSLIKKGLADSSINLAETQLVYFHSKGTKNDSGKYEDPLNNFCGDHNEYLKGDYWENGNNGELASYSLASWIGLMNEDGLTSYSESTIESIKSNGLPYEYAYSKDSAVLRGVRLVNMTTDNRDTIKQLVQEYGGIGISYYADDNNNNMFSTSNGKYYYRGVAGTNDSTNHAVFLVGWDDTISKSNFRDSRNGMTPSIDGAWIVRNSWGSSWGDNGYFYISYDTTFNFGGAQVGYVWDYDLAQDGTYLYQYDGSESMSGYSFSPVSGTLRYANVFTAQGKERLEAVSFWMTRMADVDYQIDVYLNPTSGNPASGTRAATVSGKTGLAGYYTVKLDSPVQIPEGTGFSLVVTLSGQKSYTIPYDSSANYNWTRAVSGAKAGQSYYDYAGNGNWVDAYSKLTAGNFRIKGLVTRQFDEPVQENVITASNITLTSDDTKAQTVSLNASALGGATLSYRSDNSSVTVSSSGTVTVAKGFAGTAKITITAAATSVYKQTTKVITVTVKEALPNTITASDITLMSDDTKAQTVSLNASALGGATLSYRSDNSSVTVSSSGTVTVAKGFAGTAKITITAAAVSGYKQTTKVITVTVRVPAEMKVESQEAMTGRDVTVPVTLTKNPGIAGFSLTVNYDTNVLTLNAITVGSAISDNGTFRTDGNVVTWQAAKNTTATGELMELNFTVKRDAAKMDAEVTVALTDGLDSNLSDEDGIAVPVTFVSGGVRIAKSMSGTHGSLTWELDGEGTLTISGSGEMEHASEYPWEAYKDAVRKLVVQTGVTSIGSFAFNGFEALEEVALADTVEVISQYAFSGCGKLSRLALGSGLRVIYSYAYEFCSSLVEVDFPASVSSISPSAFENCGSLQDFHVASGNENYCDVDGVLFWTGKVLLAAFPGGRTGSYTVPSSVKTIGDCAFYASKLTEIALPSGLKTIGDSCFRFSTVSQLTLPAGLENLGVGAFELCQELKTVTVPGSVKTISDSAFWGSGLESVILEDGITAIGKEAFLSCGLTEVTIPSTVTSIGEYALGYEANRMDYDKVAGFTIVALEGTAAQQYAQDNGFGFKKIPMELWLDLPDTMLAGTTVTLNAQVVPAAYDTGSYAWSLKNPEDAEYVTLKGNRLTAKAVPEMLDVTVVCVNGKLRSEGTISIVPTLTGITVRWDGEPVTSLTVDLNETQTVKLTAQALPEGASLNPVWTWSDSKQAFGTYSQEDGVLTVNLDRDAAKLGTVTLTVKDTVTKKSAAVKLTTTRKSTNKITISGADETLTGGSSVQLKAQLEGSPANTKVLWSLGAEDQAYASITAAGRLTAAQVTQKQVITVHAEAADGGSFGECQLTLVPKVQGISLTLNGEAVEKTKTVYLNGLKSLTLAATTWPEDASQAVSWTVPKNKIATAEVRDGKLLLKDFTGETGNLTVKATTMDGSKKTVSLQLKFARKPDYINILDNNGERVDTPFVLKGKQSYTFKLKMGINNDQKITDKDVIWSVDSYNGGYLTVNNGKVTVKSFASKEPVTAYLYARLKSDPQVTYGRIMLQLEPDATPGVYIDQFGKGLVNNTTCTVDQSEGCLFLYAATAGLPNNEIVWGPTNEKGVAYVESDGTVFLNRAGTVTITATNPASKKKASFKLVVTDNVQKLTVSNAPETLAGGQRVTLKAEMTPAKPTNGRLTWFLVDNGGGAATITSAGVLTAAKVTSVFTVKAAVKTQDGSVTSKPVTIRIVPAASQVAISGAPTGTVDLNTCKKLSLRSIVYPGTASQKVTWTSSNKQVQVDENGNVTILSGAKPGAVTITATAADGSRKKATVKLNLARYVTSISMVKTAEAVGGKSLTLKATPDKDATNKKLVWTMTGDTAYCTLSNGTLQTKAVARTKHVTVRATAADGSGVYAECTVTINPKN